MKEYIDKSALVAEIEKRKQELHPTDTHKMQVGEKIDRDVLMWLNALTWVKNLIDTLEVKEIDNVWHDTRRTIPKDGSEQIICIKEDGLAVSTVGKIVNRTIKWAYLDDLLNISNVQVKEVDLEKEISNYLDNHNLNIQDGGRIVFNNGDTPNFLCDFRDIAKHFFELGLKAKGE